MQTENWKKVKEILNEVLPLTTIEREKFFEQSKINGEIRKEVESLLVFEKESESLMHLSAVEFLKDFIDSDDENSLLGQNIGVYKIIRELGYGGMGAVYLAERTDGKFEQKVALKLLKREMNTAALRRRFAQEREILASLQHANIATLLDAGTTDDKVPYIAMEYVEGLPIDDYCNKHQLNIEQRLDLFREVCAAVDFAHRNLVVHRDLKPSNILVTEDGTPKLLDFGISKILSTDFKQINSATVTKMGVMTPSYASPEQLQNKSVTTATDVYSLGVILFELLSGHRPFEAKESDIKEIYKAVIELDPPLPSAIAETSSKQFNEADTADPEDEYAKTKSESAETIAAKMRHTNPQVVLLNSQSIRGDLDNIILKSLRKEPERRYSSAENFSTDIKRHLRGLPVTARPNTFSYRTSKFIGRNKASVFAGILVLLAIIGGIVATLWQAKIAQAESERAIAEAKKAEKINAYMQKILNFNNPMWVSSNPERNSKATVAEALEQTLENIDQDLANDPEIQAEILHTIGQSYVGQGKFEKAEKLLRRSIEKFDEVKGKGNLKSMQTSVILGDVLFLTGKIDEAEKYYLAAINYFRPVVAKDISQTKWLAIALTDLSNVHNQTGKFDEAEKSNLESLEYADKLIGDDRFMIPIILGNLASSKQKKGEYQEAVKYNQQALEEIRKLGNEQTFEAGGIYTGMGVILNRMEEYEQAERNLRKGDEIFLKTVGEENIFTTSNMYHIANSLYKQKKISEAEKMLNKTLEIQHKLFPKGHFLIAFSQRFLGDIYTETNRLKMGETQIREALNFLSKSAKHPNPDVAKIQTSLAKNLIAQKRLGEAKELLAEALDASSKTKGEDHPDTKEIRELLSKTS